MSGKKIKIEMIVARATPIKVNTKFKSGPDFFEESFRADSKSSMQKGNNFSGCRFANPDNGDLA